MYTRALIQTSIPTCGWAGRQRAWGHTLLVLVLLWPSCLQLIYSTSIKGIKRNSTKWLKGAVLLMKVWIQPCIHSKQINLSFYTFVSHPTFLQNLSVKLSSVRWWLGLMCEWYWYSILSAGFCISGQYLHRPMCKWTWSTKKNSWQKL